MSAGFFAIDRGVWEHPMFAREKFSEREAWIWLISAAAWEPVRVRVGRAWLDLARGQCAFALRFLAEKWQWSEPRVRRFLKRLTGDAAALVSATRDATLITICNYDDYQSSRRADVTTNDALVESNSTNPRRKEERNKQTTINKEEKKEEPRASALVDDDGWPNDFREQFWAKYPHKVARTKALKKLEGCRKRGVPWWDIWEGLQRYISEKPPDRSWMNPETFLNGERWNDQPARVENGIRTGNPRTTGHDAILAAATRAAGKIVGDGAVAGADGPAEFPERHGIERCGTAGRDGTSGRIDEDHDRGESGTHRVLEGEIIAPDKTAAGLSDRGQLF